MHVTTKINPIMYHRKPIQGRSGVAGDFDFEGVTSFTNVPPAWYCLQCMLTITYIATASLLLGISGQVQAQGAGESLGPKDSGGNATYLLQEMKSLHSALKPDLMNV